MSFKLYLYYYICNRSSKGYTFYVILHDRMIEGSIFIALANHSSVEVASSKFPFFSSLKSSFSFCFISLYFVAPSSFCCYTTHMICVRGCCGIFLRVGNQIIGVEMLWLERLESYLHAKVDFVFGSCGSY